ncbi:DUF262 domain-containing HNH endonuclease family protein [Tumebacillus sp. DT12]|uniref:DUF262 domain-containing HNH endonuclease family protein n=1 Tax=Tumebacillus lacus TaxID=2995335 RepID=A0ABT3X0R6_9BACL|nr:DUF262 domain-containing HNH endonuclease family protein [Tumebacillus lacus]MCX7569196.1 DUF262 domain-containing HNH endonuclease family protein [Tumebacillus lacus]
MKISANGKDLVRILTEKVTYEIPDYQRPYSWTKNELTDLFNDLEATILTESNHYFGAFVFNEERKKSDDAIEVIDGQQRLTTVAIFLYVLRGLYQEPRFRDLEGVEHRRNKLKEYLEFLDDDGQTVGSKFKLGEVNRNFFEQYVVNGWNKDAGFRREIVDRFKRGNEYNSSKSIKDAFDNIYSRINEYIADANDDTVALGRIKKLQDVLLTKFEVVEIVVEQDADAFLIFETLNDRGLELSSVDLIKNRLFKFCANSPDFNEVKDKWLDMIRRLDSTVVKKYLRHYWIANYGHTSHQSLFKSVREVATSYETSKALISDLYHMAPYYGILENPHTLNPGPLRVVLEEIKSLNFDLTHPILLAAFKRFSDDEDKIYKVARLCLNFMIRFITVMREKPATIEKEISDFARSLGLGISALAEKFLSNAGDSEFKAKFMSLIVNETTYPTYFILTEFERVVHAERWIAPGRTYVTVEHILPQTVDFTKIEEGEWGALFTKEQHDMYLNRLGNLTLLGPSAQGKAGNKKFAEKRRVYEQHTDMIMTAQLANYDKWTVDEIDERQAEMAARAVDIFTLDISKL